MRRYHPLIAVALSALMTCPASFAQAAAASSDAGVTTSFSDQPQVPVASGNFFMKHYQRPAIAPINMQNSSRLDSMIRAGKIYLSLEDAIALALENNIDIEVARYGPQIAQSDFLRAKAGGLLRGVPSAVAAVANSATSQSGSGSGQTGTGSSSASAGVGSSTGGTVITQTGTAIPNLDPSFYLAGGFGHISSPQTNTVTTGLSSIAYDYRSYQTGIQQSFLTGSTVSLGYNQTHVAANNPLNDLNPNTSGAATLQFTQHLLQGWGLAVNNRNIRVAKNNLKFSDLSFQQQVTTTVAGVASLYWDLVSFVEDVKVKQTALDVAKRFYEDNKKQVEIGTLAPIEVVRAEANVAQAEQDVTNAETVLLQQETIVKDALSRNGVASPSVAAARVIPTDRLSVPEGEYTTKLEELVDLALAGRPDLAQAKINVDNAKIGLSGSRSALMPSLDVQGTLTNNGLTGQVNTQELNGSPVPHQVDPYFVGGQGNLMGQIVRRNFPNYSIGFQLSMPIRNRSAQADYIRDALTVRQAELGEQQAIKSVRVNVQNAWIAVIQARARYRSVLKARMLQEQTLDAENKKYALGASTAFLVVQTQRDLATARANEVAALAGYSRSLVNLDLQTSQVLPRYHVELAEAKAGKSSRPYAAPQN
jgi:outer membrane protein TolC